LAQVLRYLFSGDVERGKQLKKLIDLQVEKTLNSMKYMELSQMRSELTSHDDFSIVVRSIFGITTVSVYAKPTGGKKAKTKTEIVEEFKRFTFWVRGYRPSETDVANLLYCPLNASLERNSSLSIEKDIKKKDNEAHLHTPTTSTGWEGETILDADYIWGDYEYYLYANGSQQFPALWSYTYYGTTEPTGWWWDSYDAYRTQYGDVDTSDYGYNYKRQSVNGVQFYEGTYTQLIHSILVARKEFPNDPWVSMGPRSEAYRQDTYVNWPTMSNYFHIDGATPYSYHLAKYNGMYCLSQGRAYSTSKINCSPSGWKNCDFTKNYSELFPEECPVWYHDMPEPPTADAYDWDSYAAALFYEHYDYTYSIVVDGVVHQICESSKQKADVYYYDYGNYIPTYLNQTGWDVDDKQNDIVSMGADKYVHLLCWDELKCVSQTEGSDYRTFAYKKSEDSALTTKRWALTEFLGQDVAEIKNGAGEVVFYALAYLYYGKSTTYEDPVVSTKTITE